MITALTVAVLVGTWACTSPLAPHERFVYRFAHDGTGSLSEVARAGRVSSTRRFTYSIGDGYVAMRNANTAPVRERIRIHSWVLEDNGYSYWHDGGWSGAAPDQFTYTCRRSR